MKLKSLIVTIAVLAALSAVIFFLNRPEAPVSSDARAGKPLVDATAIENTSKLKLSDQGKTVLLLKQKDGSWVDSSFHDLPADFQKLSQFVNDLSSATLQRLVTSNPERISRLEFKDTQVTLLDNADKPLLALTLGKNFESGGRFVRFGDEQKAYLANLKAYIDADPKNWADANLIPLKPEDFATVELAFADGAPVIATRTKKEDIFSVTSPPAGQKLKADKITGLLSSVTGLRFSDTSEVQDEKAIAAKANARTVKLTTFDGKTYTLALGRKPEQKIVKVPQPGTDGKTGPAALGKISDLAKKPEADKSPEEIVPSGAVNADALAKEGLAKALEPATETIPAGPVYAFVTSSDASAPINSLMQKLAFQVPDYILNNVPQKSAELFEPATPPSQSPPTSAPGTATSLATPTGEAKPENAPKP